MREDWTDLSQVLLDRLYELLGEPGAKDHGIMRWPRFGAVMKSNGALIVISKPGHSPLALPAKEALDRLGDPGFVRWLLAPNPRPPKRIAKPGEVWLGMRLLAKEHANDLPAPERSSAVVEAGPKDGKWLVRVDENFGGMMTAEKIWCDFEPIPDEVGDE